MCSTLKNTDATCEQTIYQKLFAHLCFTVIQYLGDGNCVKVIEARKKLD